MKLVSSLGISLVALVACIAGTGCASETAQPADDLGGSTEDLTAQGTDVPNPSGAYFANINANGTGCPAGSWDASISPDGQTFTVTFSQYETQVGPGQAMQIRDCTLGIDFRSPSGLSFAVSSFYYQGYALLDSPGMQAQQTAKYYFMGNPVPARDNRSVMTGPFDDDYLFQDTILTGDLVWSPCGTTRRLNAQTRLVLQNNPQRNGNGYLNTTSVDGQTKTIFKFNFGLSWRHC